MVRDEDIVGDTVTMIDSLRNANSSGRGGGEAFSNHSMRATERLAIIEDSAKEALTILSLYSG